MSTSKTDQNWNKADDYLISAAQKAGIDVGIMIKIAGFESGFNDAARPISTSKPHLNTVKQFDGTMAMSSAYGYGQFLDGTWQDMLNKYGEKYGVPNAGHLSEKEANQHRGDKHLQASMLAEFTKENIVLGRKLGGPDDDANVYALHNLGRGSGESFLKALRENPNQPISNTLSQKVISRNESLYGDGSLSVAEAYARMGGHMDRYQKYATAAAGLEPNAQPVNSQDQQNQRVIAYSMSHFKRGDFEYGRGDVSSGNLKTGGNGKTDGSRTERDADGDGLKGVDCSALVWRSLHGAGFAVDKKFPNQAGFTTHSLFTDKQATTYAKDNFDIIRDKQQFKPGDILMLSGAKGQHVGVFKGYDDKGHIQFFGSQVSTGPALVTVEPGGYWDGKTFTIHGALRPQADFIKPEHRISAAEPSLLTNPISTISKQLDQISEQGKKWADQGKHAWNDLTHHQTASPAHKANDHTLSIGDAGLLVKTLQHHLNQHGANLTQDGQFGKHTQDAVKTFQRQHGLEPDGIVGPRTAIALAQAPSHQTASPAHKANDHTLEIGDTGDKVKRLQQQLAQQGIPLKEDGFFGKHTQDAVKTFQRQHGLEPDGIVGPATQNTLQHTPPSAQYIQQLTQQMEQKQTELNKTLAEIQQKMAQLDEKLQALQQREAALDQKEERLAEWTRQVYAREQKLEVAEAKLQHPSAAQAPAFVPNAQMQRNLQVLGEKLTEPLRAQGFSDEEIRNSCIAMACRIEKLPGSNREIHYVRVVEERGNIEALVNPYSPHVPLEQARHQTPEQSIADLQMHQQQRQQQGQQRSGPSLG